MSDDVRSHGLEPPRLAQGGGARDPFRAINASADDVRRAIREALQPFAARGARLMATVVFDGNGGVQVTAIEVRP